MADKPVHGHETSACAVDLSFHRGRQVVYFLVALEDLADAGVRARAMSEAVAHRARHRAETPGDSQPDTSSPIIALVAYQESTEIGSIRLVFV